jgi:hypothetical protein
VRQGIRVSGPSEDSYFAEKQHFPLWIQAFPLLTAAVIAILTLVLAVGRLWAATAIAGVLLFLVFLPLAVLHVAMTLETRVDARGLHVRVRPARWSLLPRRMTQKDVPFGEMRHVAVRAYQSLTGREFWGWHLWGLSAAKGGRYLYIMRPSGPTSGRGVQVELHSGEVLLIGSTDPQELAARIGGMAGSRS